MRTKVLAVVATGAVALYWAQAMHGQGQSVPGPGTGIVTVQGQVDIRNMPMLNVGQRGDWRVTLASVADTRVVNMPPVTLSRPAFVRAGARYMITWAGGEQETIAVGEVADGAWVRVTANGRDRWLNLAQARAIEEIA
jgi:hypothetical protein